jgi:hypothetical protein
LEDKNNRAKSHLDNLSQEKPLFINPETENPELSITFRGVFPFAIDSNPKGETTIKHASLRRKELRENRLELYEPIKELFEVARNHPDFPPEIKEKAMETLERRLASCVSPQHQYSSMFKSAIRHEFRY